MERYVKLVAGVNDVLFFISSSGESKNIIKAARAGKEKGCFIIGFTGFKKNNSLFRLSDVSFWVDSKTYNIVESVHFLWLAMLCDFLIKDDDLIGKHGRII